MRRDGDRYVGKKREVERERTVAVVELTVESQRVGRRHGRRREPGHRRHPLRRLRLGHRLLPRRAEGRPHAGAGGEDRPQGPHHRLRQRARRRVRGPLGRHQALLPLQAARRHRVVLPRGRHLGAEDLPQDPAQVRARHQRLRQPLPPDPQLRRRAQRRGLRHARGHAGVGGGRRHRHPRRLGQRRRQHGLRAPRDELRDLLPAPVEDPRARRRAGAAEDGGGRVGHHRAVHRPAPALRHEARRRLREPAQPELPARRPAARRTCSPPSRKLRKSSRRAWTRRAPRWAAAESRCSAPSLCTRWAFPAEVRAMAPVPPSLDNRTAVTPDALRRAFIDHVEFSRGKNFDAAGAWDRYMALALTVRDRLAKTLGEHGRGATTRTTPSGPTTSRPSTCSGRALGNNLINMGLWDSTREALRELGVDLTTLLEMEPDAGLGNGGLGRLAACFLDSMATLDLPGIGYGIRYEFGIFTQEIINGYQVERADEWLTLRQPLGDRPPRSHRAGALLRPRGELRRPGRPARSRAGSAGETVLGVPWDTPIAGFGARTVNTLRLWQARASAEFDFAALQRRRLRAQRRREERLRGHLQGPLPERSEPGRARSCASSRSTSSSPAPSPTSCGAT